MNKKPLIVACIPAYNKEETIAKVVIQTQRYVDRVFVCDDGSTDFTAEIAKRVGATVIEHEKNMGKGAALRSLFRASMELNPDVVVTLDADLQHDPQEIPKILQPILNQEASMVIGSRSLNKERTPLYRRFGNCVLDKLTNMGSGRNASDTQSGFRAYSREALTKIKISDDGIGVDSQILMDASRKNLSIAEVPITTIYGKNTSTFNPVRHGLSVLISIGKFVFFRKPLYIGIPGLIILSVGGGLFGYLLHLYNATRYFSVPIALIGITLVILGMLLLITTIILYAIKNLLNEIK
ncbi:MAG: glycosyltransferase family 2 protein [Candidatus Nanoarchaeia archaeon]